MALSGVGVLSTGEMIVASTTCQYASLGTASSRPDAIRPQYLLFWLLFIQMGLVPFINHAIHVISKRSILRFV